MPQACVDFYWLAALQTTALMSLVTARAKGMAPARRACAAASQPGAATGVNLVRMVLELGHYRR